MPVLRSSLIPGAAFSINIARMSRSVPYIDLLNGKVSAGRQTFFWEWQPAPGSIGLDRAFFLLDCELDAIPEILFGLLDGKELFGGVCNRLQVS